ncbi:MAG: PEGA domain-containing protein, partial [Polyangiales bacterium]
MRHALAAAILLFAVDAFADAKSDAQKHFELGLELFDAQAYDSALVEFLESRKLFPTRNALKNAGTCLRELKRYDEALDMYEELLQRFGAELPPADKAFVDAEIAKLSKYVGFLTIDSDQPGATVTIDGRARGTTPLAKPVRVQIGTHAVRVSKEGFSPYEATIQVSSGASETVKAKLSIVAKVGTVKVREAKGRAAKVVVDGAMVGAAPWEGTLASGNHTIALDAGTLVAEPKSIVVENGVVLDVSLSLEERQAELRVETTIAGAEVTIDGKTGSVARLPPGKHVASVDVPGYEHWEETVDLLPGAVVTLKATNPRKRLGYLDVNIGLVPWGGDITATEATQRKSFTGMLMFRYGRLLWHKLGVEAFLGIVFTRKSRDIDVVT